MNVMMIGCDLHDKTMLVKAAVGREGKMRTRSFSNDATGRSGLLAWMSDLAEQESAGRIVFAYEASGQGFGLYDRLTERGVECHVLAPTKMAVTPAGRRQKTDERDALKILELLKGHILAGNELPEVWIPDTALRNDRSLLRARGDVVEKRSAVQAQIRSLLKVYDLRKPEGLGKGWTRAFHLWLQWLGGEGPHPLRPQAGESDTPLGAGARMALGSLLRQFAFLQEELKRLEGAVEELAASERYAVPVEELQRLEGVGLITAMVFLTEMGDPRRFRNRRQVAAYFGLAPASYESGDQSDRKGHITHQGPPRVRKLLCQAAWTRVRTHPGDRRWYESVKSRNPKKGKVAVVALMRRLGILMWHRALAACAMSAAA